MISEVFKNAICHFPSFKEAKCVSVTIVSSNINEVIRAIWNFFIQKLHDHKKHKTLISKQKYRNASKKYLRGK